MTLDLSYLPGPPPEVLDSERIRHRRLETWRMEGSAGGEVRVDAHVPSAVKRVVVIAHGADNSRKARYVEVAGKSFTRHGSVVVAMDAPRHGDRDGAPLETFPGLLPGLVEEWVRDHRRLLDVIGSRWPDIPIGFAGFSMGGLFGVPLMATDDRIASGAVVIAGSTRVSYPARFDATDADRAILEVTDPAVHAPEVDRPVLVLAARDDEIVPLASVRALAGSFGGPSETVVLPGTHTEWGRAAEWFRTLDGFFRRTLGDGRSIATR